ncbi:hypothetical protein ABID42_001364 [Arcicella rosea]|uniref:hypothetical protein n=1 Tax=Arcicella rosea TaxID=502909 RepID=UPI00345CDB16
MSLSDNVFSQKKSSTDVHVNGYYRNNGTYVKPYYRTSPNKTNSDNFSTIGNTNPYTGKEGTIIPDKIPISSDEDISNYISNIKSVPNNSLQVKPSKDIFYEWVKNGTNRNDDWYNKMVDERDLSLFGHTHKSTNTLKFIVKNNKAYFYSKPLNSHIQNRYLIAGDIGKVVLIENRFVFIEFYDLKGNKQKGWIRRDDIYF